MRVEVRSEPFEPWAELAAHEHTLPAGEFGATAVFVGTMRDFNVESEVRAMTLEHYPGMTEKYLETLAAEAMAQWELSDILIVHRVGRLLPADPIVLVAAWSAHRKEAFDACRQTMESLKSKAPFWKKETLPDGERWVEKNTPG